MLSIPIPLLIGIAYAQCPYSIADRHCICYVWSDSHFSFSSEVVQHAYLQEVRAGASYFRLWSVVFISPLVAQYSHF